MITGKYTGLINDIVWLKQKLMLGIAATNLLFTDQGREAVSRIKYKCFGIPGLRMDGPEFLEYLKQASQDTDSFDGLHIVQWKMALLDLHEELNETLSEDEYQILKDQEWFRALYHLRNGIGHDKRFRFTKKKNGSLSFRIKSLLPVNYQPIHSQNPIKITETSHGQPIELSEKDVFSIFDEAELYLADLDGTNP